MISQDDLEEEWLTVYGYPIPGYGASEPWFGPPISPHNPEFDKHLDLLGLCYEAAIFSTDRSTQLGVVLVKDGEPITSTLSCNSFVRDWDPEEHDHERPRKYSLTEHAERRAIYMAARNGVATEGLTMYASWAACADCARAIVESGITTLVRHSIVDENTEYWNESIALGDRIMEAGGVTVVDVTGYIPGAPPIIRGGKTFYPDSYA